MLSLILFIALIGLVVYLIESYIPMPEPFKLAIRIIVIICLVLYVLRIFGVDLAVPRVP